MNCNTNQTTFYKSPEMLWSDRGIESKDLNFCQFFNLRLIDSHPALKHCLFREEAFTLRMEPPSHEAAKPVCANCAMLQKYWVPSAKGREAGQVAKTSQGETQNSKNVEHLLGAEQPPRVWKVVQGMVVGPLDCSRYTVFLHLTVIYSELQYKSTTTF